MITLSKSDFITHLESVNINTVLKETTVDCYPGRLYALNNAGWLVGYWSEKNSYIVYTTPLKHFSKSKRTFKKIKTGDL